MAGERPNLTGVWRSRYEYGDDKVSEHTVNLRQHGLKVEGSSRLDPTGSELFLHFRLLGDTVLGGEWEEITSRQGEYGGRKFQGWGALALKGGVWAGLWVGPNRDDSEIKSGKWTLEREAEEDVGKEK